MRHLQKVILGFDVWELIKYWKGIVKDIQNGGGRQH